ASGPSSGREPAETMSRAHTGAITCCRLSEDDIGSFDDDRMPGEFRLLDGEIRAEMRAPALLASQRAGRDQPGHGRQVPIVFVEQFDGAPQPAAVANDAAVIPRDLLDGNRTFPHGRGSDTTLNSRS